MLVQDNETLNDAVILVSSTTGVGLSNGLLIPTHTLTLGTTTTVRQTAGGVQFGNGASGGAEIVNDGTITAGGGTISDNTQFFNAGTLALLAGESFVAVNSPSIVNNTLTDGNIFSNTATGLITIASGATLNLGVETSLSNAGSIDLASGSTLILNATLGTAALAGVAGPGTIEYIGTLNLGGGTLTLGAGTQFAALAIPTELSNGTIVENSGTLAVSSGATLSDVTVMGPLNIGTRVTISNGLTVETASGGSPGTITLGTGAALIFTVQRNAQCCHSFG